MSPWGRSSAVKVRKETHIWGKGGFDKARLEAFPVHPVEPGVGFHTCRPSFVAPEAKALVLVQQLKREQHFNKLKSTHRLLNALLLEFPKLAMKGFIHRKNIPHSSQTAERSKLKELSSHHIGGSSGNPNSASSGKARWASCGPQKRRCSC